MELLSSFLTDIETAAKDRVGHAHVQGPDGAPALRTIDTVRMLASSLDHMRQVVEDVNPDFLECLNFSSLMTLVCE